MVDENKKYPSVTIQGVLLGTNLLLFEQSVPNINYVISTIILLALFFLQAVNHRFYYFFPMNTFTGRITPHVDTVILYIMILAAFLSTILGITNSIIFTAIATTFIAIPPFLWRFIVYKFVREKIAKKLSIGSTILDVQCPNCGKNTKIERKVKAWNEGEETVDCAHCSLKKTNRVVLNIG